MNENTLSAAEASQYLFVYIYLPHHVSNQSNQLCSMVVLAAVARQAISSFENVHWTENASNRAEPHAINF